MSRPLVLAAAAVFGVLGLLPLAVMLLRIAPADLAELADARTLSLLGRTLALGGGTAALAFALGLPFGFLVARTDLPGAALLRPLGVVPLLLPPLLLAMSWTVILPHLRGAPATILFLALSTFPLVALFSARAFERIDATMEEAARLAGGLRAVLRLDLPLALPAACCGTCLAFAFAINDFGVPDYVSSVGPKFNVYADEIKLDWDQFHRPGKAVATALPLIAVTLAALVPALALRRAGAMASLGSGFRSPPRLALGRL
ncbi:MAG: ABC transporter permease subunit, partial [Planctomycetota bacterium]